jgi:hypothetical protein
MMRIFSMLAVLVAVAITAFGVTPVQAQAVDAEWAKQFVGSWDVKLGTPDGEVPLVLTVSEDAGALVLLLGQGGPEGQTIRTVERSGQSLVAKYEMNYQGMALPAQVTVTREGEGIATKWSFADGAFETAAPGTRR